MNDSSNEQPMDLPPHSSDTPREDGERAGASLAEITPLVPAPSMRPGEPWRSHGTESSHPADDRELPGSVLEVGALTRGRRRDLEGGMSHPGTLKIVYWGPGRSGKTTNVKWLHSRMRPEMRSTLIDLDTPNDRTLYFDCLPLDLSPSGGSSIRFRLYTVPGQPRHRLTRKLVLTGAQAIVFVWDARSRRLNANLASLIEMRETLAELGVSWASLPRVIQYNKLDLADHIPPEELDHVLDRMGERGTRIRSVATQGRGVMETLSSATRAALHRHQAGAQAGWLSAATGY